MHLLRSLVKRRAAALVQSALFFEAVAGTALLAQPIAIDLDPAKTRIDFVIGDVLHTVHGTFKLKSGHIEVNPQTNDISGQMIVDASSGYSGNDTRDSRMKNDILEAGQYPEITFTPEAMKGALSTKPSAVTVSGWFTVHGKRHQVFIPVQVTMPGGKAVIVGRFVVPYVRWGMQNPSTFLLRVTQEVEIDITAVGSIEGYSKRAVP